MVVARHTRHMHAFAASPAMPAAAGGAAGQPRRRSRCAVMGQLQVGLPQRAELPGHQVAAASSEHTGEMCAMVTEAEEPIHRNGFRAQRALSCPV